MIFLNIDKFCFKNYMAITSDYVNKPLSIQKHKHKTQFNC